MSYDLYLFANPRGENLGERLKEVSGEEGEPLGPADEAKELRKRRVAEALLNLDLGLEQFTFDYARVAEAIGTTEDQARRDWRHIELNGDAVQITLHDDYASITIPYWDSIDRRVLLDRLAATTAVIRREAGWDVLYDPQLERALPEHDLGAVLGRFEDGIDAVRRIVAEQTPAAPSDHEDKPSSWLQRFRRR